MEGCKTERAATRLNSVSPIFLVADVVKAAEYYRDVLGFRFDRYWGEPPCFCIVWRDAVEVFLKGPECPGQEVRVQPNRSHSEAWDIYINVNDADALLAELRAKGAKIVREPEDTVYHMREFEVEDLNGYAICFGQDISGSAPADG